MTYQLKFTTTYKKSYKLMKKRGLDITLLDDVVDWLRQGKQLDEKVSRSWIVWQLRWIQGMPYQTGLASGLSIVNDIRNCHFGLAKACVYGFCKRRNVQFVMSFTIIENDVMTLTLVDTGSHSDIFKR